ncbi:MAG: glycosyltransferase family 39 protein [Phycisphaerae bacterium]|nr:glycosyltransferase family 39 protein [Phycisphaerae bacterium]
MKAPKHLHEGAILAIVLLLSFLLKLHNLGHAALTYFDECFHAIVARNLLNHPLKPTLVETPYLPYDFRNWTETHVWLHKGILPLWQIALAYAVLGVNTFALRLPSAILGTGAVWLTYLIGKQLLDRRAALIAAALQAFNASLTMLVHGYWFSDHVDTALTFWVELGIYFLIRANRTGRWHFVLLAGLAQGLAFLCKQYLAAIIFGLALVAWLLPIVGLGRTKHCRLGPKHLLGLLLATLITVAPWTIWCLIKFPDEFLYELLHASRHLGTDVEGWGAPWDRVLFDYMFQLYFVFYTPVIVAAIALLRNAFRKRHTGLWLTYAWVLGVLVPHLLAESKTPSATILAMPPLLLLLGYLISEAWRNNRWALLTWTGVMAVSLAYPTTGKELERGYTDPPVFAGVMRQEMWIIWHVLGALLLALLLEALARCWRASLSARRERIADDARRLALCFCVFATLVLGYRTLRQTWNVTERALSEPAFAELAAFVRDELPDNAVLLVDVQVVGEHQLIEFRAERTCYIQYSDSTGRPGARTWQEDARRIVAAGGIPYLVTPRPLPLHKIFTSTKDQRFIYEYKCPQ